MTKESESQSIESLIQKKDRLGRVIKQRFALVQNRIGTGEIKEDPSNLDASLRVGVARESVAGSIPRLEAALTQIDEQIIANEFLVELAKLETKVVKARELNQKGFLSREVVEAAEKQLADLKVKVQGGSQKRDIATLSEEHKSKASQRSLHPDQRTRDSRSIFEVELNTGKTVRIRGKVKSVVLNKLIEKLKGGLAEVPIELISQELFGSTENHEVHRVYDAILGLRRDLEKEGISLLKGRIKKGQLARFRIRGLEEIVVDVNEVAVQKPLEAVPEEERVPAGEKSKKAIIQPGVEASEGLDKEKIRIYLDDRRIEYCGKVAEIDGVVWNVFIHLAKHAGREITHKQIGKVARKSGSKTKTPASRSISNLRRSLTRVGLEQPIATLGGKNSARYVLNVPVEIVRTEEGLKEQKLPDDTVLKLPGNRGKLLNLLLTASEKKPILISKLCKAFWKKDNKVTRTRLSVLLNGLKKDLASNGWGITMPLTKSRIMRGEEARYFLSKIEVTKESKQTKPKREISPLSADETAMLSYYVSDKAPEIDGILRIIGPQSGNEKYLSRPQALKVMLSTIRHLYRRVESGTAEPEERLLWAKIKEGVKRTKDSDALETFKATVSNWFRGERAGFKEEIKQIDEIEKNQEVDFSAEGKAILASLYFINSHKVKESGFANIEAETVLKLLAQTKGLAAMADVEIYKMRADLLTKVKSIIEADDMLEIIALEDTELKNLLLYFVVDGSKEKALEFLGVLSDVEKNGEIFTAETSFIRRNTSKLSNIGPSDLKTEMINVTGDDFGKDRNKLSAIEKMDPAVASHAEEIVDQVQEKLGKGSFNMPRITRAFPFLTQSEISWINNKGYVRAFPGKDGRHPAYESCEVAIMIYVKKYGDNLNKRHAKSLRRLFTDVCEKKQTN